METTQWPGPHQISKPKSACTYEKCFTVKKTAYTKCRKIWVQEDAHVPK